MVHIYNPKYLQHWGNRLISAHVFQASQVNALKSSLTNETKQNEVPPIFYGFPFSHPRKYDQRDSMHKNEASNLFLRLLIVYWKLGMAVHKFNPSTQEKKVGRSLLDRSQLGLQEFQVRWGYKESLSQKDKKFIELNHC